MNHAGLRCARGAFSLLSSSAGPCNYTRVRSAILSISAEQYAYVVEMRENALGAFVGFTAEDFIAVNTEAVEKIVFLGRSFLHEPRKGGSNGLEFSGMNFEIRVKTDKI